MVSILTCIAARHDPWLVALALVICSIGAQASVLLTRHACAERGGVRLAWIAFAAIVIGTTAWTAHFVAVLGFIVDTRIAFDPGLTFGSLLIAMVGACIALLLATSSRSNAAPALGGALLGLAIAAMHYTGMLAFRLEGLVRWNPVLVLASIAAGCLFCSLAMAALSHQLPGRRSAHAAAPLLVAAMLSMHFIGMTAIEIIPFGGKQPQESSHMLALAIAVAAGLVIFGGCFAGVIDARNRREAARRLIALARVDRITGLPNRSAFEAEIRERCRVAAPGERFAIIVMEVANLAVINQQFGTRVVELVTQAIADRLVHARKQGVILARTGEAQFSGVGEVCDRIDTLERATKLHAVLSQDLLVEGIEVSIDMRLGGVAFPEDASEPDMLIGKAQAVLARAIADPLNPIALPDEAADADARRRLAVGSALQGALGRNEFALFYQPQVRLADGAVVGHEALLRWQHPVLGMVSPGEFIPIAEQTGRILKIGEWILNTACREATRWPEAMRVAVNMSALQLRQPDLPQQVAAALATSGLAADRLEIELTESLLIEDQSRALQVLRAIKALGVRLALDDFGTGYSSMEVLRIGVFDKIKLDKSFVDEIESDARARAILNAMLALGRELLLPILAEGVETRGQLALLADGGCDSVQGYLTGRPAPAEELRWEAA